LERKLEKQEIEEIESRLQMDAAAFPSLSPLEKFKYLFELKPISAPDYIEFPSILEIISELNKIDFNPTVIIAKEDDEKKFRRYKKKNGETTKNVWHKSKLEKEINRLTRDIKRKRLDPLILITQEDHQEKKRISKLFEYTTLAIQRVLRPRNAEFINKCILNDDEEPLFYEQLRTKFISATELIKEFKNNINNNHDSYDEIIAGELKKYEIPKTGDLRKKNIFIKQDEPDIKIRSRQIEYDEYEWDYRYLFGFINGKYEISFTNSMNIRLIDEYFLNLGIQHSIYNNFMTSYSDKNKQSLKASTPDKILMLETLDVLNYLKKILNTDKVCHPQIIELLSFLLSQNKSTIAKILLNTDKPKSNKNDYRIESNYNKVIEILNDLDILDFAQSAVKEREKIIEKNK
jgi:hypothetical protein